MKSSFLRLLATGFIALSPVIISACGEHQKLGESGAGGSSHNEGRDCTGCHTANYAGTVYKSATGGVAPNAVVVITENNGTVLEVTADNSGNFYTSRGNPSGGYSVTIRGNTFGMVSKPTSGACSSGGCHDGITTLVVHKN
ncbi:MAG: carboxypeptidase regulatory-like domain-containing protein [Nitrospinae bacterium]|nr:carboxypeptidase regulatory-like domain-containing protein [Nitrospinota bacterium]MBF0635329.1 carboxypeptidase regulatory-like domain-containing protein [Nitrospinota bacterium]